MKKMALSLACAIGLTTMFLTGCGTTDTNWNTPGNNNGVTTRGTNQGFLLAENDRIRNTAEDSRMRHLRSTGTQGLNRSDIMGYGVNGTTGLNGNESTGIGGSTGTMTSPANTLLIGDVLIVAGDGSGNSGRSGVMGMANGTTDGETTGMANRRMSNASRVWQVTDKHAIKALNRVQYNLSMNPRTKASEIGRDLSFLLKYVKPAGQGTGMNDEGTTNGSRQTDGSIR